MARKARGFSAVVAGLHPVAQKGAEKICVERLEIIARRNAMLARIAGEPHAPRPTVLEELEGALGRNTSDLRRVVGQALLPHVLAALDSPDITAQLSARLPQEEDMHASPPKGSSPDEAARLWRRRIVDVPHGVLQAHAVDHDSPTRTGQTDLRNRLAKAAADPTDSMSYYQKQQVRLGRGRRGSTSHAGAWEGVWASREGRGGGESQGGGGSPSVSAPHSPVGMGLGDVDAAAVEALLKSMREINEGGGGSSLTAHACAQEAHACAQEEAGAEGPINAALLPAGMLQRLQSSIDSVAAPVPSQSPVQTQTSQPPRGPAQDPPATVSASAAYSEHQLGHEQVQDVDERRSVYTTATMQRSGHAAQSYGLLPLPRDTLSARSMATGGALGSLAAAFTTLPRKSQIAARELALDVFHLHTKLDMLRARASASAATNMTGRKGHVSQPAPSFVTEVEQALSTRFTQLLATAGREVASILLAELNRDPASVRQSLGLLDPSEQSDRESTVFGCGDETLTGGGQGAVRAGWTRRALGGTYSMRDTATVRKAAEPSSLVFNSLPTDGIQSDGSRSLFAKEMARAGVKTKHAKEENVSYYERTAARYGRSGSGHTSAWAAVWADEPVGLSPLPFPRAVPTPQAEDEDVPTPQAVSLPYPSPPSLGINMLSYPPPNPAPVGSGAQYTAAHTHAALEARLQDRITSSAQAFVYGSGRGRPVGTGAGMGTTPSVDVEDMLANADALLAQLQVKGR